MACQLENHKGEAQLKNDLQGDQACKGVVIPLLGRGQESRDEGNGDKTSCTAPESCKDGESNRLIKPNDRSYDELNGSGATPWRPSDI